MCDDGFATFISDDLPGFDSLSGSGFFDQAGGWEDDDNSDPAHEDDNDGFGNIVVRTPVIQKHDGNVFFFESEDDGEDASEGEDEGALGALRSTTSSPSKTRSKPRQRRSSEAPSPGQQQQQQQQRERRRSSVADGKKRTRRVKSSDGGDDAKSVGSRQSSARRHRRSDSSMKDSSMKDRSLKDSSMKDRSMKDSSMKDGSSMSQSRTRRASGKRADNLKKKGLDLGSQLDKISERQSPQATPAAGTDLRRRLGRRGSCRELGGDDNASVGAKSVQSTASGMGRRAARARRATQSHDLLARNLQQYGTNPYQQKTEADVDASLLGATSSSVGGSKDAVWKQRRRRNNDAATAAFQPAIAAW